MDNNNEYKRNAGMAPRFPSYGETPQEDNYSSVSDYGSTSDYSSTGDYSSIGDYSNMSNYSSMSNYERTTTSDFGSPGDLGSVPGSDLGETDGYYKASYNENNYYQASYNEQDASVEQSSEKPQGNYYSASYYEAEEAGSKGENNTEEDRSIEDRSKEDTSTEESDGGMSQSDYQALYSDYNSSQMNNYRTSPYSASGSGASGDDIDNSDKAGSNDDTSKNGYAGNAAFEGYNDYSTQSNSYSDYNTQSNSYSDYNAPEDDYNSSGSSYGDSDSHSNSGSYSNYSNSGDYGSTSGAAESSGMSEDRYTGYHGAPLDRKGRPLKNTFGKKLAFSIIELVFATFWGILALIFTCMANSAFQKGDWDAYQSRSKVATVMLWIGLVLSILSVVLIGMFVGLGTYGYKNMSQVVEENVQEGAGDEVGDYEATGNIDDTDNTDVADNADTADAADGSTATGGNGFDLPDAAEYNSFTVNGLTVSVPAEVSDYVELIESLGYTFDADLKNTTLPAHEDEYLDFMDRDGMITGFIDVYNTTDGEIAAKDGIVGGIYLDVSTHEDLNITYINGIDNHSGAQAYVEALGEPQSSDESFGYYQWYTEEGWISVEIHDGELSSLSIYAYAMLK